MTIQELKEHFEEYDRIRENIFCRLVSPEYSGDLLQDTPQETWMDLAKICYCVVDSGEDMQASARISSAWLEVWGISREQLFRDAEENRKKAPRSVLRQMDSLIPEYRPGQDEPSPLYVLTVPDRPYGAICMTEPETLEAASVLLGGSFYILPSSVHECILLQDDGFYDPEELSCMVREINRTELLRKDILSDHVYRFDAGCRCVTIPCGIHRM